MIEAVRDVALLLAGAAANLLVIWSVIGPKLDHIERRLDEVRDAIGMQSIRGPL